MFLPTPFASKELADGKKLFRRKHGYVTTLNANGTTTLEINVPYNVAKINEVDVLWCPEGITADLTVHDTPTGTISGVPNYQLNKFGFNVAIAKDYWTDHSPYDADVIKDMKIKLILTNNTEVSKDIAVNIVFHEVI